MHSSICLDIMSKESYSRNTISNGALLCLCHRMKGECKENISQTYAKYIESEVTKDHSD